jgi:hypothetical protein
MLGLTGSAAAETQAASVRDRSEVETAVSTAGARTHDGFYLRLGIGLAGTVDTASPTGTDDVDSATAGAGPAAEIGVGHAVAPRLILGAGAWGSGITSSLYTRSDGARPTRGEGNRDLVVAGVFGDCYLENHDGWHAQLGFGIAQLGDHAWLQGDEAAGPTAIGGGLMVGLGYEWWVDDQWGIGALARFIGAVTARGEAGETWIHTTTSVPALMLTATYN